MNGNALLSHSTIVADGGSDNPLDSMQRYLDPDAYRQMQNYVDNAEIIHNTDYGSNSFIEKICTINEIQSGENESILEGLLGTNTLNELQENYNTIDNLLKKTQSNRFYNGELPSSLLQALKNIVNDYELLNNEYTSNRRRFTTLRDGIPTYNTNLKNLQKHARSRIWQYEDPSNNSGSMINSTNQSAGNIYYSSNNTQHSGTGGNF